MPPSSSAVFTYILVFANNQLHFGGGKTRFSFQIFYLYTHVFNKHSSCKSFDATSLTTTPFEKKLKEKSLTEPNNFPKIFKHVIHRLFTKVLLIKKTLPNEGC